jgi:hypothetical protein
MNESTNPSAGSPHWPSEGNDSWRVEWPDFVGQFPSPLEHSIVGALNDLVLAVEYLASKATLPPSSWRVVRIRAEERPSQLGLGLGSGPWQGR